MVKTSSVQAVAGVSRGLSIITCMNDDGRPLPLPLRMTCAISYRLMDSRLAAAASPDAERAAEVA